MDHDEDKTACLAYLDEVIKSTPVHTIQSQWNTGLSATSMAVILNKVGKIYIPLYHFLGEFGTNAMMLLFLFKIAKLTPDILLRAISLA